MTQDHLPLLHHVLVIVVLVAQTPGCFSVGHPVEDRRNYRTRAYLSSNELKQYRKYTDETKHTLNDDVEVSLVLSCRVGDHTRVLPLMGQHGILNVKDGATLLNADMDVSTQQLKTKRIPQTTQSRGNNAPGNLSPLILHSTVCSQALCKVSQ